MIVELGVENFALLESVRVEFESGLTALTGETGAGKSLLIDALGLALGERAASEMVRTGCPKAIVTLVVEIAANPAAEAACREQGWEPEEGRLVLTREVTADGRSTARVNGRTTPIGALRTLGMTLADLHGQHEHQALLDPERRRDVLDNWIGAPALEARRRVAEAFAAAEAARATLRRLVSGERERAQRIDLLRFQAQEIAEVDPQPGETVALKGRLAVMQNAEKLREGAEAAIEALAQDEAGALDRLHAAIAAVEAGRRLDEDLLEPLDLLSAGLEAVQDGLRRLRHYVEGIEHDPAAVETIAERLDALGRLRRKYGETEEEILAFLAQAEAELAELEDASVGAEHAEARLAGAERELADRAAELTAIRTEHAAVFGARVESQLHELAMPKASFQVVLEKQPIDASGGETIDFLFTANIGEAPKPLAKVASGGELSRTMLAVKVALAGRAGVPTLIFDEVDAGLSGQAAAAVARKLTEVAEHRQVIVISHLPQIASRAQTQFRIAKSEDEGRTYARIEALSPDERVREIARMLAGEIVGPSALENARELLAIRL